MHQCNISAGGGSFDAGLFQTSCFYILRTHQPNFDAACLATSRVLDAFSPNKLLNVANNSGGGPVSITDLVFLCESNAQTI